MTSRKTVLILGGAGFIGSRLVARFVGDGCGVTVIDALAARTGGRREHLAPWRSRIDFIESPIEQTPDLDAVIAASDLIVDCLAWTAHRLALHDPLYDLTLNAASHLHWLTRVREDHPGLFIYLGSRGQYGRAQSAIDEASPLAPEDIQGIHKLAAESYFRVYARLKHLNAVSLRVTNCFGENQPLAGDDLGLVGGFIDDLLAGRTIDIYGAGRRRNVLYVGDLVEAIARLAALDFHGFEAFNVAGDDLPIDEIARMLVEILGRGELTTRDMPDEIRAIDIGNAPFLDHKLRARLPGWSKSDVRTALAATIEYFQAHYSSSHPEAAPR